MKEKIYLILPFIFYLVACNEKFDFEMQTRKYETADEEQVVMYNIQKDSFAFNHIPKKMQYDIVDDKSICFRVNTILTDGYSYDPIVIVNDSVINVTYKKTGLEKGYSRDLIYPVELVYYIRNVKPKEKKYTVFFLYPQFQSIISK